MNIDRIIRRLDSRGKAQVIIGSHKIGSGSREVRFVWRSLRVIELAKIVKVGGAKRYTLTNTGVAVRAALIERGEG